MLFHVTLDRDAGGSLPNGAAIPPKSLSDDKALGEGSGASR